MAESVQIQSISHRHQAIADVMLAEPTLPKGEIAKRIGVSQSWLSIVIHSDVFREYYDARRTLHDQALREQITSAQLKVTLKAYDKLDDVLDCHEVKPEHVLQTADHMLKALGYEPRKSVRVSETKTIEHSSAIDGDVLADARARMTRSRTVTIEQDVPA